LGIPAAVACICGYDRIRDSPKQQMSATAAGIPRPWRFWQTTIGKKAVMAVTGIILAGFVLGHLLGNLQIFLGPDAFNSYARTLRHLPELVWPTRIILLISVI